MKLKEIMLRLRQFGVRVLKDNARDWEITDLLGEVAGDNWGDYTFRTKRDGRYEVVEFDKNGFERAIPYVETNESLIARTQGRQKSDKAAGRKMVNRAVDVADIRAYTVMIQKELDRLFPQGGPRSSVVVNYDDDGGFRVSDNYVDYCKGCDGRLLCGALKKMRREKEYDAGLVSLYQAVSGLSGSWKPKK